MSRCITRILHIRNFASYGSQNSFGYRLTSTTTVVPSFDEMLKLNRWLAWYDEITGLQKVLWAQNRVIELEQQVLLSQSQRREVSLSLDVLRTKIRELNSDLENTTRGDDKYVQIITQENRLLKEEKLLGEKLKLIENGERDLFSALSAAVRESHENERARAERTKYWSIIGTLIGSAVGVLGSTFNNRMKLQELKKMFEDTAQLRNGVKEDVHAVLLEFAHHEQIPPVEKVQDSLDHHEEILPVENVQDSVDHHEEIPTVEKVQDSQELVINSKILKQEAKRLEFIIIQEAAMTRILIVTGFIASALAWIYYN